MPRKDEDVALLEDTEVAGDFDLDGDTDGVEDDYDGSQEIRLNLSDKEAEAEGKVFTAIPGGVYDLALTDAWPQKCGPTSNNPGKPYWRLEFTVQSGPHEKRKVFTNAMLFEGALYTWVQLAKAYERDPSVVPALPVFMQETAGKVIKGVVSNEVDKYKMEKEGWTPEAGPQPRKNEIKSFLSPGAKVPGKVTAKAASDLA